MSAPQFNTQREGLLCAYDMVTPPRTDEHRRLQAELLDVCRRILRLDPVRPRQQVFAGFGR